jgi:Kef-type K+ transport system membrane component KefB
VAPKIFIPVSKSSWNLVARKNPVGYLLVTLFVVTVIGTFLGISVMFSSFCAGFIVASAGDLYKEESALMKRNAFGLSIPIYFCMVGFRLNLLRDFHAMEFLLFALFACIVKAGSVYFAARVAKEDHRKSIHLAISMNARGGPGIVLASVALQAKIINDSFYVTLVLLALLTSMGAGTWLERALSKNEKFT